MKLQNIFLIFLSLIFIGHFFTDSLNNDENVHFYYSYFIQQKGNLYFDVSCLYAEVLHQFMSPLFWILPFELIAPFMKLFLFVISIILLSVFVKNRQKENLNFQQKIILLTLSFLNSFLLSPDMLMIVFCFTAMNLFNKEKILTIFCSGIVLGVGFLTTQKALFALPLFFILNLIEHYYQDSSQNFFKTFFKNRLPKYLVCFTGGIFVIGIYVLLKVGVSGRDLKISLYLLYENLFVLPKLSQGNSGFPSILFDNYFNFLGYFFFFLLLGIGMMQKRWFCFVAFGWSLAVVLLSSLLLKTYSDSFYRWLYVSSCFVVPYLVLLKPIYKTFSKLLFVGGLICWISYHYFSATYNHIYTPIMKQRELVLRNLTNKQEVVFWVSRINPRSKSILDKYSLLNNHFREISLRPEFYQSRIPNIYREIYQRKYADKKYRFLVSKNYYLDNNNNLQARDIFLSTNLNEVVQSTKELYQFTSANKGVLLKSSLKNLLYFNDFDLQK